MKKLCNYLAAACLLVCGCIFAFEAQARVCFATDENCGSGGNFGNYDPEPLNNACIQDGYNCDSLSGCSCNTETQIKYNCPYRTSWLKCCGKEYFYAACTYPLQNNGECGGKYRCRCDRTKFGYNDNYTATSCEKQYPGSLAGGGSCVETSFDTNEKVLKTDIYYSDCICNRATYPYLREDCTDGTEPSADGCTGTDGTTRYSSCICNTTIYPFQPGDCEFGGNMDKKEYYCIQGGSYHFKRCYNCDAFPATSLDHVKGGEGVGYEKCTYGNRYKILQCESGYRPGKDGANCRELTCEEAVDEWLTTYPAQKERYTLLSSAQNIKDSHLVNATSSSYQITTQNVILGDDQTIDHMYPGINYYGASAFGKLKGGYMAERCKLRPMITYKTSSNGFWIPSHAPFNYKSETKGKVNLYGLKLKISYSGTFFTTYGINGVNTDIYAANWMIPEKVDYAPSFTYNAYYDNEGYEAMPSINVSGTMTIKSYFSSNGYSYNTESGYSWGTMKIEVPVGYKSLTMAEFRFKDNQDFKVSSLYMYPATRDMYADYNTTIKFIGPSSDEPANVYTSIYLGLDDSYDINNRKISHNMYADISGSLIWNLYKGSSNYSITLSPGSRIRSTDYGSGEYARIKRGSDSKWKYCQMSETQRVVRYGKHSGCWFSNCCSDCKFRPDKGDDYIHDYALACSVDKSGSTSSSGGTYKTSSSNCSCGNQQPDRNSLKSCIIQFGEYTHTLLTCGE